MPSAPIPHDLESIFRDHHAWLFGRLLRRVANRCDAEDAASETFVQLGEDGGRTPIRDPRAFLTTIAKRVLFQLWRRQDLEQAYRESLRHVPQALALSPEEHAQLMDAIQQIDCALAALPLPVRTAFLLSRLDGLSYPEIAARLGVSLATVERHMKRALLQCLRCAP
ncbi:sigma-70 family RNA polymerase sigma factor [Paracidovorax anthurii]|uniref:RNA polymerase sigma-70 factor (ECF subfamily) n=1 Tax=Paracidovorax anthurii TaxID=78229 RepID=A0A328ZIZ2_9BURK|nr:sigma-70 family RNA polymerase sigma factor [Paracidovorax anthurii]RAR86160.1 RNA polymerase sigma-70 factor (ECF subfamily) [Paracidovorax anthurii]